MEFKTLLDLVKNEPLFDTSLLLAGNVQRTDVQRQLARWQRSGHVQQVRRGLYSLAPPYRHQTPHPFLVANRMVKASYVSCQSALAWYGLIPEYTPTTTSVSTSRPGLWNTPFGAFIFRHIKHDLLFGYAFMDVTPGQQAFVASPEKALLDLIHLTPGGDHPLFLQELRLQNFSRARHDQLQRFADRANSPKLQRAVQLLSNLVDQQEAGFDLL